MAKKPGLLKKVFGSKCFSCNKYLPKTKSGTYHYVKNSYGEWKKVCMSCKRLHGGSTMKPMFKSWNR